MGGSNVAHLFKTKQNKKMSNSNKITITIPDNLTDEEERILIYGGVHRKRFYCSAECRDIILNVCGEN